MNRVENAAAEGSVTAKRTLEAYTRVNHVSQSSRVKGSGNRPPLNDNVKGDTL